MSAPTSPVTSPADSDALPDDLTDEERRELGLDVEAMDGELDGNVADAVGPDELPVDLDASLGLSDFFDAWDLYADPALASMAAGAMLGVVGVYIVMRNLVFLTAAASQVASLGVVLSSVIPALTLGAVGVALDPFFGSPLLGAFVLSGAATLWVATGRNVGAHTRDAALGTVFVIGSAGTLALGSSGYLNGTDLHDVRALLLGNAVAVVPEAARLLYWTAAFVLAGHLFAFRGFREVTVDRIGAQVRGIPVRRLEFVLWLSIALAIAVSTRVLGALPTFAYAVIPAWGGMRVAANQQGAMLVAGVLGATAGFGGYVLAFVWGLSPEAVQPLLAVALVGGLVLARALIKRRR